MVKTSQAPLAVRTADRPRTLQVAFGVTRSGATPLHLRAQAQAAAPREDLPNSVAPAAFRLVHSAWTAGRAAGRPAAVAGSAAATTARATHATRRMRTTVPEVRARGA